MMPDAKPVSGADNLLDIVYLPQREAGVWEDRWLRMNVHVPLGSGPFPCIVFVHGGGWGGGDKDGGLYGAGPPPRELIERALREGYVAVNLNYILGRGTRPQVFWDYRAAIRHLRAGAGRFRIDPGRIAAWGFSAGGWLSSTAGFSNADDRFACKPAPQSLEDLKRRVPKKDVFFVPLDDPRAADPEFSSRVTAIVADFWQGIEYLSGDDPPMLTYVGEAARHRHADQAEQASVDFTAIELIGAKYRGQISVHVPPPTAAARPIRGVGTSTLADEAFAWLEQRLRDQPRSISPEARPNRRVFAESAEVKLVAAAPNAEIRYTLDGSEPNESSPIYRKPLMLNETTTVRAISTRAGERPSAVASFHFLRGELPEIASPAGPMLPKARVGQPYHVQFAIGGKAPVLWNLAGHLEIGKETPNRPPNDPAGLHLDRQTGLLSGTPTAPGVFTFQIQSATALGQPADARVYVLVIEPKTN